MKKLLTAMCLSMLALAMAGALAACNENDESTHTHDMTKVQAVAATCTEDGNEAYYKCSECGKYFSDEAGNSEISLEETVIAATGHKVEKLPGKAATCTEDGLTEGEKCSVCGEVIKAQEVIKSSGHTVEKLPGKAATCTEDGLTEGEKCSVCGEVIKAQQVIKSSGHTPEVVPGKAATCTEDGLTEGEKCSVCGEVIKAQQVIKSSGHDMTFVAATQPTCSQTGNRAYYLCNDCGKRFADEDGEQQLDIVSIAPLGHTLELVAAVQPTCTQNGTQAYYKCADCGATFADEFGQTSVNPADLVIESSGHTAGKVVKENEVPATCTAGGSYDEVTYCSVCGDVMSKEHKTTPMSEHTMVLVPAAEPTCTEYGHIAYYECSVCKKYYSSDAEGKNAITLDSTIKGEPNGHSASQTIRVGKEPTATAEGTYEYVCPDCQTVVKTEPIPALTQENVDAEVYTLVETYTYNASRRAYACTSEYTLAESKTGEPLVFEITRNIRGTAVTSFPKTYSTTGATAAKNFNEITSGYLISGEAGWYEITINTADVFMTATIINSDGTTQTLEFMPESNTALFECNTSTSKPSIIVFHNYTSAGTTARTISFTVDESEISTVSLTQSVALPTMVGGNYMVGKASESGGGEALVLVDESVVEGEYFIYIDSPAVAQIGRNNRFAIIVNGVEYETYLDTSTSPKRITLKNNQSIKLKGGDVITIISANQATLSNLTFSIEQA